MGYSTSLHFIELPSADFALGRVAIRVAAGGHDVPEAMSGDASSGACACSLRSTNPWSTGGTIGSATNEACDLSTNTPRNEDEAELEIMLEAARRATWDALHGPRYLRSGRFRPTLDDDERVDEAAQPGDATSAGSRRD